MASNHFLNAQGQPPSAHPPGAHSFGTAAHNFSAPAPSYLSSMGLLPSGAPAPDHSAPFSSSAHGHHTQHALFGTSAGAQGGSLHMSMPSTMSAPSGQHNSVRPSIVKRARNNGRSRNASRAASAIDDAGAVMFAAEQAASAAASHHGNSIHNNRFMQQLNSQPLQMQQQSQHYQQQPRHQQHQQSHHPHQMQQQQHQRLFDHHPLNQRHTSSLHYGQHQQDIHQQDQHSLPHHQSSQPAHMLHSGQQHQLARHVSQSQPNMMGVPPIVSTGPVYECDGIQFKMVEELPDVKVKRLKSEKIKPIEELTFEDIKAYNRNQLRAYCFVYGIKRKKKAEMEQNMARYAAMFHPGDSSFDLSKFVPTDYLPGPIPRRKVPVTKEQKALSAGKFAARLMSSIARPNAGVQQAFAAPASLPSPHYGLSHAPHAQSVQQHVSSQQQLHTQQQQQLHAHQLHQQKLQYGARSQHDPLAGFHNNSSVMVAPHLLGDMGEE